MRPLRISGRQTTRPPMRKRPEQPTPEDTTLQNEPARAVADALRVLPLEQRLPIELAYYEGLSQSQVADRLSQPLGTIKTRVRLGFVRCRSLLNRPELLVLQCLWSQSRASHNQPGILCWLARLAERASDEETSEDGTTPAISSAAATSTPAFSCAVGDGFPRAGLPQAFLPYRECARLERLALAVTSSYQGSRCLSPRHSSV